MLDVLTVDAESIDYDDKTLSCSAHISFAGEQEPEMGMLGNTASGEVNVSIDRHMNISFEEMTIEIDEA